MTRSSEMISLPEIRNWCETHTLGVPVHLHEPSTEREAQDVLRRASFQSGGIQVLGNRYSWPKLIDVNHVVVMSAARMRGVSVNKQTIEAQAGASLSEVSATLRGEGMCLSCSPPVIANQTIGGAIATGTHGQGLGQSTLGDSASWIRLVDAQGQVRECKSCDADFGAFILHLGCLGFLTSAGFDCSSNLVLTCEKRTIGYKDLIRRFHEFNRSYLACKVWWFPWEDCAHVWLARAATEVEKRAFDNNGRRPWGWGQPRSGANQAVDETICLISRDTKSRDLERPQFKTVLRFRDAVDLTGYIDDIFCQGIPVPQINCEVGVPLDEVGAICDELRSWFLRSDPVLHYPVILRATGPSKAWLSPAYARETCYFGFVMYQAADGTFPTHAFPVLDQIQSILASAGGFPHWGKYFCRNCFKFEKVERWEEFNRLRRTLDPTGRFTGKYLQSIFHS